MGKKGGSETTEVKLPPEIEAAAKANLKVADEVAAIGMTPYTGPTVAGFTPQQMAAMQGTDNAAAAFGMPSVTGGNASRMTNAQRYQALTGMAPPRVTAGGVTGYSGLSGMEAAIAAMPPAQRAIIQSFVRDPVTGAKPTNASVPAPATNVNVDPSDGRTAEERKRIAANRAKQQAAAAAAKKRAAEAAAAAARRPSYTRYNEAANYRANPAMGRDD